MALIGHPLVGDRKYTAGYVQMSPDRPVEREGCVDVESLAVSETHAAMVPAECRSLDRSFCLWAVELQVGHPVDGRVLCFKLQGVPLREAVVRSDPHPHPSPGAKLGEDSDASQ